ncbi:MAG: antibiotic biosynthesis monooxygenase [Betaproteobacteria bacterium]|nr:antibiotic biosynthesis monooxygenase [Betaproteobacteria bacterium]
MTPITTITIFEVPPAAREQVLSEWKENHQLWRQQTGRVDGVFYRCTDADGRFQFINLSRWESEEALNTAYATTHEALTQRGYGSASDWARLGVTMAQSIYREEIRD